MKAVILCAGVLVLAGACKKSGNTGGWLVGAAGLMANVQADGSSTSHDAKSSETLRAIACRDGGEGWVAGNHGTLLYTGDAGETWTAQAVPTTADLYAIATQDAGPVFVAGDGTFLISSEPGARWTELSDRKTAFRAIAAAPEADLVLAVDDDGGVWAYDHHQLARRARVAGARAIALSPNGHTAMLVGDHLLARSSDGGRTWTTLATSAAARYDAVRVDANGVAIAVGARGAIAHVAIDGSVVMQHVGSADLHALHLAEIGENYETVGFAAGEAGQVWITRDGGWSWREGANVGQDVLGVDEIGESRR